MTTAETQHWMAWAPPMDPPTDGGLPAEVAQRIADACWATDPHLCAALQWEAYAGMLPPTGGAVASVSTGAQSVSYSPPMPGGDAGLAMARAAWHRTLMSPLGMVPLVVAEPAKTSAPGNPWALSGGPDWGWEVSDGAPPGQPVEPYPPPVAAIVMTPASPGPNTTCTFDASTSAPGDPAAPITRYDWDTPDGSLPDAGASITWRTKGGHGSGTIFVTVTAADDQTGEAVQGVTW